MLQSTQSDDPETNELEREIEKDKGWWTKFVEKKGLNRIKAISAGPKLVVLLHILAHSIKIGDKTILFSQCLKTLDFIEQVLQIPCWADKVKSLKHEFPDLQLGSWENGKEYFRIDGNTNAEKRGELINVFNKESNPVNLFLISSKAGGVGYV